MNIDKIKAEIAKKPRHIILPAAVLGVIVLLAIAHIAITHAGRSQNRAPAPAVAQVSNRTPAPAAHPAQIEPVKAADPARASSASPASGAPAVAAAPTAAAPIATPAGVIAGTVDETVQSRDQFNQWLTLSHQTIKLATLNLATSPAPPGFAGTRRVVYSGWIKTSKPTATVTLHAVGASADVTAAIDGTWSLDASHSNAWVSAPTVSQSVIALSRGWHRVQLTVTTSSPQPTAIELQLGSGDTNPTVPVPYSVPVKPAGGAK